MQRTYYKDRPANFERGRQFAKIRLDITEETTSAGADGADDEPTVQYSCLEFTTFEPLSQNKFIEVAFTGMYGNDYENKLINEYNAALLDVYTEEEKQSKIERYKEFLQDRASKKTEIEAICIANNIN